MRIDSVGILIVIIILQELYQFVQHFTILQYLRVREQLQYKKLWRGPACAKLQSKREWQIIQKILISVWDGWLKKEFRF